MDAVILASSGSTHMFDLSRGYHKPLLRIDGIPLVCRAVDLAHAAGVSIPVVVVAPRNAEAIELALGERHASLIIQRKPKGPGHALALGLSVHTRPKASDRVLLLLSDTVSTDADVTTVAAHPTAIGVRKLPRVDALEFTRFAANRWIDRETIEKDGPDVTCWIGPVVGDREKMIEAVYRARLARVLDEQETPIGPYLSRFMRAGQHNIVEVSSRAVGTIESFPGGQCE